MPEYLPQNHNKFLIFGTLASLVGRQNVMVRQMNFSWMESYTPIGIFSEMWNLAFKYCILNNLYIYMKIIINLIQSML